MTYITILFVLRMKDQSNPLLSLIVGNLAREGEGSEYQQDRSSVIEKKEYNKEVLVKQEKANMLEEEDMNKLKERVKTGMKQETQHNSQYTQLV